MPRPAAFLALIESLNRDVAAVRGDLVRVREVWENAARDQPIARDVRFETLTVAGRRALWSRTQDDDDTSALLYLHGGAYTICSIDTHRYLYSELGRSAAMPTLAIDYRLAPEHPFPAALDDAMNAYRWLLDRGLSASRIAVAGDSAGGGLTLALLLRLRDEGLPLPAGGFVIAPWTDLTLSGTSLDTKGLHGDLPLRPESLRLSAVAYAGGTDLKHPWLSPLFADVRGLPPILVHVSADERLLDDALRMTHALVQAGGAVQLDVWPDQPHIWHGYGWLIPEGRQALDRAGTWLRERIAGADSLRPA